MEEVECSRPSRSTAPISYTFVLQNFDRQAHPLAFEVPIAIEHVGADELVGAEAKVIRILRVELGALDEAAVNVPSRSGAANTGRIAGLTSLVLHNANNYICGHLKRA